MRKILVGLLLMVLAAAVAISQTMQPITVTTSGWVRLSNGGPISRVEVDADGTGGISFWNTDSTVLLSPDTLALGDNDSIATEWPIRANKARSFVMPTNAVYVCSVTVGTATYIDLTVR